MLIAPLPLDLASFNEGATHLPAEMIRVLRHGGSMSREELMVSARDSRTPTGIQDLGYLEYMADFVRGPVALNGREENIRRLTYA